MPLELAMFIVVCHRFDKWLSNLVAVLVPSGPTRGKVDGGNEWISGEGCPFPLSFVELRISSFRKHSEKSLLDGHGWRSTLPTSWRQPPSEKPLQEKGATLHPN